MDGLSVREILLSVIPVLATGGTVGALIKSLIDGVTGKTKALKRENARLQQAVEMLRKAVWRLETAVHERDVVRVKAGFDQLPWPAYDIPLIELPEEVTT